jgi:hypothetical protein
MELGLQNKTAIITGTNNPQGTGAMPKAKTLSSHRI